MPAVVIGFAPLPHLSQHNTYPLTTSLNLFKDKKYKQVVENLMTQKGLTRQEAEKDYDAYQWVRPYHTILARRYGLLTPYLFCSLSRLEYRNNPTGYALQKGEAYYRDLGYKSLMEGVVGEAEKEGRGDEVRERIAAFRKKSQLKAAGVLIVVVTAFCLTSWLMGTKYFCDAHQSIIFIGRV